MGITDTDGEPSRNGTTPIVHRSPILGKVSVDLWSDEIISEQVEERREKDPRMHEMSWVDQRQRIRPSVPQKKRFDACLFLHASFMNPFFDDRLRTMDGKGIFSSETPRVFVRYVRRHIPISGSLSCGWPEFLSDSFLAPMRLQFLNFLKSTG